MSRLIGAVASNSKATPKARAQFSDAASSVEVLIVDDDPSFLRDCGAIVERWGGRVRVADTVAEALVSLRKYTRIRIVFTDMYVGEDTGVEVLRAVKAKRPNVAVVVVTQYAGVENVIKCFRLGANDYITKPIDEARVYAVITQALRVEAAEKAAAHGAGQVFLSYAREDSRPVKRLYSRLSGAGFSPWMDSTHMRGGQQWRRTIRREIRRSSFFLACLSCRSVTKQGVVQQELREALEVARTLPPERVYLIPVRLEDCDVPDELAEFTWVDLHAGDGWEKLRQAIHSGLSVRAGKRAP